MKTFREIRQIRQFRENFFCVDVCSQCVPMQKALQSRLQPKGTEEQKNRLKRLLDKLGKLGGLGEIFNSSQIFSKDKFRREKITPILGKN